MKINGREIFTFPTASTRTTEQKWGVAKLPKRQRRVERFVLVLGSGRSGTLFTTHALRHAGLDVRHEFTGADGTVSNYFLVDSDWYPMIPRLSSQSKAHVGERRDDYRFQHTVLISRDPLRAIPSIAKIFSSVAWEFYTENYVVPDIFRGMHRAMVYWTEYNRLALEQADFVFQLEKYKESWPELAGLLGLDCPYPAHLRPMNKSSGNRRAEPTTWKALKDIDPWAAGAARAMAKRLGYGAPRS